MIFGISGCSASGKSFIVDYLKKNKSDAYKNILTKLNLRK